MRTVYRWSAFFGRELAGGRPCSQERLMAARRRGLVPRRLTSTDMRAEMQHAEGWRSAELVEANHVWDSNELRELILSQCSLRCLHARCAVVCSSWRLTVASPIKITVRR